MLVGECFSTLDLTSPSSPFQILYIHEDSLTSLLLELFVFSASSSRHEQLLVILSLGRASATRDATWRRICYVEIQEEMMPSQEERHNFRHIPVSTAPCFCPYQSNKIIAQASSTQSATISTPQIISKPLRPPSHLPDKSPGIRMEEGGGCGSDIARLESGLGYRKGVTPFRGKHQNRPYANSITKGSHLRVRFGSDLN